MHAQKNIFVEGTSTYKFHSQFYFFRIKARKGGTLYGLFSSRLDLGQKLKIFKILLRMQYSGFSPPVIVIGEVSTSVREEIFLHEPRPFLAWDIIWVVLPLFY